MPVATDLLDRYLAAVRRCLPPARQNDITAELAANLHAQIQGREAGLGRPLTEDEQADMLRRHGHPLLVAASYRPRRSLIGPVIFPLYWNTLQRTLPLVIGVSLLVQAAGILFGAANTPISQRIDVGQLLGSLVHTIFIFLAIVTLIFAVLDACKGSFRKQLHPRAWDPRQLPLAEFAAEHSGPHHPYADVFASGAFLAWLLLFPHSPVLLLGPELAWHFVATWHSVFIDLPAIWHRFYWAVVTFSSVHFLCRLALLSMPVRRYYHLIESVVHLFGIGIIVMLLRARDYIGQATFGPESLSPQTVGSLNLNIHRGLLFVLILAIAKFLWDTARWLRPTAAPRIASKMGAPS